MSTVADVTDATFSDLVLKSSKPVVVDYWADWCAPCKQLSPIIDELARDHGCLLYTSRDASSGGANLEIPPWNTRGSNLGPETGSGTVHGG